jgi:hypothetical protein
MNGNLYMRDFPVSIKRHIKSPHYLCITLLYSGILVPVIDIKAEVASEQV